MFSQLEEKIQNVDKEQLKDVIIEVKDALNDGKISEKERDELLKLAKERLGEPFSGYNI